MDQDEFDELLCTLRDGKNVSPSDARQVLEQITDIFQEDISMVEAQVYVAMAVDLKLGIFSYLSQLSNAENQSEHSIHGNISRSFAILEFLVDNFTLAVEPHAYNIIRWGLGTLIQENNLRIPSLKLMKGIISKCPCSKVDLKYLADKLMNFLEENKKLTGTSTLRQNILVVLGDICVTHPDAISHASDSYLNIILRFLNEYEVSKYKSNSLVEGCLNGLYGYLTNFSLPEEKKGDIFKYLKLFCCLGESGERHTVNRAALSLYIKHSSCFSRFIYDEVNLINTLSKWVGEKQSSEHKKLGLSALSVTYRTLAAILIKSTGNEGEQYFNSLRNNLELLLRKENNTIYDHKHAVIGIAELSSLYIKFGRQAELITISGMFRSYSDTLSEHETWAISIYVETEAKILEVLQSPFLELTHLSRISVLLIDHFPKIPSNFRLSAAEALESSFMSLSGREIQMFNNHVRTVLYQGLIRCCSHQLHVDAILVDTVSVKSFLPLWSYLLTIKSRTGSSLVGSVVYDSFISVFIEIIQKLDLSLLPGVVERSDPSFAFEARSPNDFLIFINIVDLFQGVIPVSDHTLLHRWLAPISREILRLSRKSPLISGFYKVFATIFEVTSSVFSLEVSDAFDNILFYLKDSLSRVTMFKDDLQISCLRMILLAPICFIENLMHCLDIAFLSAIRIGTGYPELLQLCVSSLDRWVSKVPKQHMQPLLEKVLPFMSCLVRGPGSDHRSGNLSSISKGSLKGKRKIKRRVVAPAERRSLSLQKQFILLLGKLDSDLCSAFTKPVASNSIYLNAFLTYKFPLRDCRPDLNLNGFIPHITSLALSAAERSTRVTACELLHSILLIAIERTQKPDSNAELLRNLLQTALRLGCDSDKVIRDLFNPLLLQICRYFSGKVQMLSKGTAAVIEVLHEGCCHEYDSSLRDFSAECIREFVIWSRKQNPETYALSPVNVSAVIRNISNFASHPDRSKRLGASAIFNSIYREIREDTVIMSTYWFQLYHCFMRSLELSDDEESARVVIASIEHIRRPLIDQKHIFLVASSNRRVPPGFVGGTLQDLLLYTFTSCHSLNMHLREVARLTFITLLKIIPGESSIRVFLSKNRVAFDLKIDMKDVQGSFALLEYIKWLLDQEAVDVDSIISPELLDLRSSLLLEVSMSPSYRTSSVIYLLQFCRNTAQTLTTADAEVLAGILFKIDFVAIDEFVRLLSSLRQNALAMEAFLFHLPALDINYLKLKLKDLSKVSFFIAFEVLDASSMLTSRFVGDDVLLLLFDSLFSTFGRRVTVRFLENCVKDHLRKMFRFSVKCGISLTVIVKFLLDKTEVNYEGKACLKGEVFLMNFRDEVVDYLTDIDSTGDAVLSLGNDGIKLLMVVLERILDTCKNADEYNAYASIYLKKWSKILEIVESDKKTLLALLQLLSAGQPFGNLVCYKDPSDWLLGLITSKEKPNPYIQHAFDILPQLSSRMEFSNEALSQNLISFRRVQSAFYDLGPYSSRSEHASTIRAIYRGLLSSFKHTGSLVILKFTMEHMSSHLGVISEEEFDSVLNCTIKTFPDVHILKMADTLLSLALISPLNTETVVIIRERLAIMLQYFSEQLILSFFGSHISELYNIIMDQSTEASGRIGLRNRTTCVRLMEILYLKSNQPLRIEIQNRHSSIPNLFKNIINRCSSWSLPRKDSEFWRLYNCACVKLISAIVCQTKQERNYDVLLFKLPIWNCVTDHEKKYNFNMDFAKLPQKKKVLTSIRQANKINENQVVYPKSQVLFESSLQEDVTKFDLSNSFLSQSPFSQDLSQDGIRTIELELDSLNEHEIIATICGVVEHMIAEGIMPEGLIPCWLKSFLKFLTTESKNHNSRLMVLKVIYNLQNHIKPYAPQAAPTILRSILSLQSNTHTNYFIMDLMSMLLRWDMKLEGHEELVTKMVENVLTHPNTTRKDIMTYILESIKSIVEKWKNSMDKRRLTEFLLCRIGDKDEFVTYVNLSIASVLLTNELFLMEKESVEKLSNWLLSCIKGENKNYPFASEVLGLALKTFRSISSFEDLKKNLFEAIIAINSKKTNVDSEDIIRLHSIHKFYPEISSNEYISSNLEVRALRDSSSVRQNCLEMLLSHVQRGNNLLEPKYLIIDALKSNVRIVIEISINILKEIINKIEDEHLEEILQEIIKLTSNSVSQVRYKSCEILALILLKQNNIENGLLKRCEIALIKRLNDNDDEVRNVCETFWYDFKLSSKTWEEQLLCILKEMYSSEAETDFVTYTSSLIMTIASHSFDYERVIFDRPLAECSYSEYKVLVSWRARHSSLAPMFAPSVAGELQRLDFDRPVAPSAFHEQIRATARSLLFSPTLTDEPILTAVNVRLSRNETQNELDEGVFKKPKIPFRFSKMGNNTRASFARRAIATRDRVEAEAYDRVKRRETDVKLYRNYKKGDYPDIQIKHSHFILPLGCLARKDTILAKLLILQFFSSATNDTFWNEVGSTLNEILQKTSYYDSTFLSFVLQLSLERELILDSENVCIAAKSSGLVTLGTLVIERSIIHNFDDGTSSAKRMKNVEDESSERWLHLAQLFQELQDSDGQQGIFLDKLEVRGAAYEGILYEAAFNWVDALKSYEEALKESFSDVRDQFYCQAYLKCLANLGDWSKVNSCILGNLESKEKLWEDPWRSEILLPLFLRSELMTSLENNKPDFQNFVREFSNVSALSSRFPIELTLASWMDDNYPKTLTYFNQSCLSFLTNWSQINNWDSKRKEDWLVNLQILCELNEVVEFVSAASKESAMTTVLENWDKVGPSKTCDLLVWDARLALRKKLCSYAENTMQNAELDEMKTSIYNSQIALTEVALEMEQFHIAKKYLKVSKPSISDGRWIYCRDAASVLGIKLNQIEPLLKIEKYFETWQKMELRILNAMDVNDEDATLPAKVRKTILHVISSILVLVEEHGIDISQIRVPEAKKDLKHSWLKGANDLLGLLDCGQVDVELKGEIYVNIAKFHRRYMGSADDTLKAILRGMKYGNKEARQLFCCVLTVADLQESADMVTECAEVPTWMFLLWRHQLLAYLSAGSSMLAKNIIKRIAVEYPKALTHSLRVSMECSKTLRESDFIQEIKRMVSLDPSDEAFVTAISKITVPPLKLRYYIEKILDHFDDLSVVKGALKNVQEIVFAADNGDAYRCLDIYKNSLSDLLKNDNLGAIKEGLKSLLVNLGKLSSSNEVDKLIKMYSPWLGSFLKSANTDSLEIPGQYEEDYEPKVQNHIRIAGFKPELLCLPSKRRPFKITIIGSNAREYSFLYKFGEDLRQDERIQQVLRQMQCTLKAKKLTEDLDLQTFKVIPLMSTCGLIEWLDSAVSLRDMLSTCIASSAVSQAQHKHLSFLGGGETQIRPIRAYIRAFSQVTDEMAIAEFHRRVRSFPEFALRTALCRLSTSPEQMVHMRRNFAKSLAVMSIAHWLVGVGDRHEENILVSTESGRAIGIDFGVAFGFATQFLLPPELIPFRLTPQIINVFSPLKESGWVKQAMVRTLRVLRENTSVLLAMLEVFVLEPSMDWRQQAERLAREKGVEECSADFYPRQKVNAVERKLSGAHPSREIAADLATGHKDHPCLDRFLSILQGKSGLNVRSGFEGMNLSPEQQVDCLIELAMDPLILSFTYVGWNPWL